MTEERDFDGHKITQIELDAMRRIIKEANVEITIEDGDIVIQAVDENDHVQAIGRCDLRRVAAQAAEIILQDEEEAGVFALAGLFSKCVQIILNHAEPRYTEDEDAECFGGMVRLFAGNSRKNPPDLHAV